MKADQTLDTFGLLCPMPIVKTTEALKAIEVGQVLEVIASDEGIREDMPAYCRSTGHEFLGIEEEDGEYRAYLRKMK